MLTLSVLSPTDEYLEPKVLLEGRAQLPDLRIALPDTCKQQVCGHGTARMQCLMREALHCTLPMSANFSHMHGGGWACSGQCVRQCGAGNCWGTWAGAVAGLPLVLAEDPGTFETMAGMMTGEPEGACERVADLSDHDRELVLTFLHP